MAIDLGELTINMYSHEARKQFLSSVRDVSSAGVAAEPATDAEASPASSAAAASVAAAAGSSSLPSKPRSRSKSRDRAGDGPASRSETSPKPSKEQQAAAEAEAKQLGPLVAMRDIPHLRAKVTAFSCVVKANPHDWNRAALGL